MRVESEKLVWFDYATVITVAAFIVSDIVLSYNH